MATKYFLIHSIDYIYKGLEIPPKVPVNDYIIRNKRISRPFIKKHKINSPFQIKI